MSSSISYGRNILLQNSKNEKPSQNKERENPFSNTVLIGNWYEERFANKIDRKAIIPGTYGEGQCIQEHTLYKSDFQAPIPMGNRDEYDEYIKWRQRGFSNRLSGEQTNVQLSDGDEFVNNLTTFTDIMFRIKSKEDTQRAYTLSRKGGNDSDYMRSYGNSTKTDLLTWLACKKKMERDMPIDVSHYKNNFKPTKINEKRILSKGVQGKMYMYLI